MAQERKYSLTEIDAMRRAVRDLGTYWQFSSNGASGSPPKDDVVEQQLRTHMQNGTEPSELTEAAAKRHRDGIESAKRSEEFMREHYKANPPPPPRVLRTAEDVIDEWYETCVAKYAGATATARDLYDGVAGRTLKRFANNHAPDGVDISQRDMERYLDRRGVKSRSAMFAKRYDGVQVIIHGNVRSGNYGT